MATSPRSSRHPDSNNISVLQRYEHLDSFLRYVMRVKLPLAIITIMVLLLLVLVLLIPISEAACNYSTGWKSVADSSRAVQANDGGGVTLIPTQACSQEEGYCLTFSAFIPNAFYLSMVAFDTNSSIMNAAKLIWTANRSSPIPENSTLEFTGGGNLILETPDGKRIWSTNTSGMGIIALSICGGDLKLVDVNHGSIWESFSYPTDTLIPGQILEIGMKLISSKSSTDLSEGSYSLMVENCGIALYYSNPPMLTPLPYWVWTLNETNNTVGVQDPSCSFEGLLMRPTSFMLTSYTPMNAPTIINNSIHYTGYNEILFQNSGGVDPDPYTYLKLEPDGILRAASFTSGWSNVFELDKYLQDPCFVPSACISYGICSSNSQEASIQCTCPVTKSMDAFSPTDSCRRLFPIEDNCTRKQALMELSGIDYFPNKYIIASNNYSTEQNCKDACLYNCSCLAAFYWKDTGSCFLTTTSIESLKNTGNQTQMAYLKIQLPQSKSQSYADLVIGLSIGGIASIVLVVICIRHRLSKRTLDLHSAEVEKEFKDYHPTGHFRRFSLKELDRATQGFCTKVGEGGFGTVFLGCLEGDDKIAVKRVECSKQGKKSFRAEIEILGNIQHMNLVHLLGFCAEGNELLLVYEFVANSSLDQWIFHASSSSLGLSWKQRWKIAAGVAHGLAYLHEECRKYILHLDIKPQNILVDENFEAKLSDFGLSTLMEREQSHVLTTMRGTPGYFAPEWLLNTGISSKSDVYSFGMVLFELISGRKNMDASVEDEEKRHYPSWAWRVVGESNGEVAKELVDPFLQGEYDMKEVEVLLNVAFLCIQADASTRPTMGQVVKIFAEKTLENHHVIVDTIFGSHMQEKRMELELKNKFSGVLEFSSILSHGR